MNYWNERAIRDIRARRKIADPNGVGPKDSPSSFKGTKRVENWRGFSIVRRDYEEVESARWSEEEEERVVSFSALRAEKERRRVE